MRADAALCAHVPGLFSALGDGRLFDHAVRGAVAPLSVGLLAGAFLFGAGTQITGGCAAGTLCTAGGGNTRMIVTLLAFIAESVIGVAHQPMWQNAPSLRAVSLIQVSGSTTALVISLTLVAAIAWMTSQWGSCPPSSQAGGRTRTSNLQADNQRRRREPAWAARFPAGRRAH